MCLWSLIISGLVSLIDSEKFQMTKKLLRNLIYADKKTHKGSFICIYHYKQLYGYWSEDCSFNAA